MRDDVILEHYPTVRAIAGGVHHRLAGRVPLDELVSAGMLGLVDGVRQFDPARGVPLKAYVELRVRTAIFEALREADWVPRRARRTSAQLAAARAELRGRLGRDPSRAELADRVGVAVDRLDAMEERSRIRALVSLDTPAPGGGGERAIDSVASDDESALEMWIHQEDKAVLAAAIAALPERLRGIVRLYYEGARSSKEIGAELGVSEGRVFQLRSEAVRLLRDRLRDPGSRDP